MIAFYGQGGLGNQLFQYAAARRLSDKHGCTPVLDPDWFFHPRRGETPRPLELKHYPVVLRLADIAEQKRWRWTRGRFARHLRPLLPLTLVREEGLTFSTTVLDAPANSYMFGYWQSEKYFIDIRHKLLCELSPLDPPTTLDQAVIDLIQTTNAVSVHVRRGDYVTLQSAFAYHGLCSLDYYSAAIQHISERVVNPTLFIFSDDPEWTRKNLVTNYPTHYVNHNTSKNSFQDLRLMSFCKHHILANSSFSWWGAWLSEPQSGVVVAPMRWYAVDQLTPDLIPDRWIRI